MTYTQKLKEYLISDNKGFLKTNLSDGKVIMLSGRWGSGKTHFWKNCIEEELINFQQESQKSYVYCSLYGNTSISKLEDNIQAQAYLSAIGGRNHVLSGYEKVRDFGKRFGSFCSLLDVSKLVDGIDDIQQKNIKKTALSYLEDGGLICFDDFERKSKDIDLNDLFGLISHYSNDLRCKVVIILNDDAFEGKEKDIFSNVKEKSVSKFLKYNPSIEELFESIYTAKYKVLNNFKEKILSTIKESEELNARIYIQVLDNLLEWSNSNEEINENIVRCIILVNINFILYHTSFSKKMKIESSASIINLYKIPILLHEDFDYARNTAIGMNSNMRIIESFDEYLAITKNKIKNKKDIKDELLNRKLTFIDDNIKIFKSDHFLNTLDVTKDIDDETLEKIVSFIETGILK